jgi:Spy/CpxP family protein refolding chaperone
MSFGRKIISVITLAFAMITLTTFAAAQDTTPDKQKDQTRKQRKFERKGFGEGDFGRGMRGGRHAGFGLRALHRLDLTDAQKDQIRGLMEASKTANEPFRQEMRSIHEKRRGGGELTEADKTRMQELRSQMKQSAEQTHNSVLSILTAEQRQQLEQWKQERQKQKEERRQKMQERRQEMEKRRTQQTPRTDS